VAILSTKSINAKQYQGMKQVLYTKEHIINDSRKVFIEGKNPNNFIAENKNYKE
jgi:hypothetical protein